MNKQPDLEILPEDRIRLNKDQKNLITLALEKQLPLNDAEFLESVQKKVKHKVDAYTKIKSYFIKEYGDEFGKIFLAVITNGEEGYKEIISNLEQERASERIRKATGN